jgi:hypothetical protein
MADLEDKTASIITGIVHPRGSAGGAGITLAVWTLGFELCAWRDENGKLRQTGLWLSSKEISREELRAYMDRLLPYTIIQVKVSFTEDNRATLIELLDENVTTDEELNQISLELQKPKTFEHEKFGTFVLDREIDRYVAKTPWLGKEVQLQIGDDEGLEREQWLHTALQLWENQDSWHQKIMDAIIKHYLPLKNGAWRDEDDDGNPVEEDVSAEEFKSRLSLDVITIYNKGGFSFNYEDGDLFFGHWIEVYGNLETGILKAKLWG